jgi:hypothetical protein
MTRYSNGYPLGSPGVDSVFSVMFLTRAEAQAAYVAAEQLAIVLWGYTAAYDAPPAYYKEVTNTGTVEAWQFQTNGGSRRWQLAEQTPDIRHFGPTLGFTADTSTEWQNAIDYVETVYGRGTIRAAGAYSRLDNPIRISASGVVIEGDIGNKAIFRRGADTGYMLIVGPTTSVPIARSGVVNAAFQDLTGVGTFANSPYGVWFNNVNEAKCNNIQFYNETLLWRGIQLTWHGDIEFFWAGNKDYSASESAAWTVTRSTDATYGRKSSGIWSGGYANLECGTIVSGGATINSMLAYGISVAQTDGFEVSAHIQSVGTAAIRMQDFTTFTHGLSNVSLRNCFIDLSNGNGINILGDRAITGFRTTGLRLSHGVGGLGASGARYGILCTGILQKSNIHIETAQGTQRDLVLIQNASCNLIKIKVDQCDDIGMQTANTYSAVSIAAGTQIDVELGHIYSTASQTMAGVYVGGATYTNIHGGLIVGCAHGVYVDSTAVDTHISGINAKGCATAEVSVVGGATRTSGRGILDLADFGP